MAETLLNIKQKTSDLINKIGDIINTPSDDIGDVYTDIASDNEKSTEVSPIEVLQSQMEELQLNLAVTMKANMALGQLVSELQQELAQTSGQLANIPRLQQQIENFYQAINEMLSTGRMGNPNRS